MLQSFAGRPRRSSSSSRSAAASLRLRLAGLAAVAAVATVAACSSSPATVAGSTSSATGSSTTGPASSSSSGSSSSSTRASTATGSTAGSGGAGTGGHAGAAGAGGEAPDGGAIGGNRPVTVHVPPGYTQGVAAPLVILLHGYGFSGAAQELYFNLTPQSDAHGFLYAHPDGTVDAMGNRFWNATDACCNFYGSAVDDATYLSDLVDEISQTYTVDPKRVFFIGHSNGAFMSHRMACDHADKVAAIVSLAGATWQDVTKCKPVEPVAVVEIHGTADMTVPFAGGAFGGNAFPSATQTVADWTALDGCAATADTSAPNLDLDVNLPGAETTVTRYASGCKPGGHAELWTVTGGAHIPALSATFAPDAIGFLLAHPKP